jgi:hypothetical protein
VLIFLLIQTRSRKLGDTELFCCPRRYALSASGKPPTGFYKFRYFRFLVKQFLRRSRVAAGAEMFNP